MCLPIGFLKTWLSFTTFITMLGGVGIIIFAALLNHNLEQFVLNNDIGQFKEFGSVKNALCISLVVLGVFTLLCGMFGMIATCKESGCCTFFYNIFNIVLVAIMVIVTLVFIIYFDIVKSHLQDSLHCLNNDKTFYTLNKNVNSVGNDYFCTSKCGCKTFSPSYPTGVWNPAKNVADLMQGAPSMYQCSYKSDLRDIDFAGDILVMAILEEKFNCAGFCQVHPWKSFSTISTEYIDYKQGCGPALYDFLIGESKLIGIVTGIISVILIFTSLFACCLCCHPDKKKNKKQYDNQTELLNKQY